MAFSVETRQENLDSMSSAPLDILIIGGGITGAGVALHAAAMGFRTGLIEMQDFAGGTSSRSTKLVHGGLRYLKQFEVEMVADVARERAVLHQNAPHIVKPQMMLLPVYDEKNASFTPFSAPIALDLYDRLAEVNPAFHHFFVDKEEVIRKEPTLKTKDLKSGGIYLDYMNDDARLTLEIIKKAAEIGALPANYVKAEQFLFQEDGKIQGVIVKDVLHEKEYRIEANVVVNATGPWSDKTLDLVNQGVTPRMVPTKGVHFVVDKERLPVHRPIYTDTGLEDDRMIFIIPRKDKTYFGTTDTFYEEELLTPHVTKKDVDYLLSAINNRFPDVMLTVDDIESSWAGIRPLLTEKGSQDPSDISRTHDVSISDKGLVTISGGKLTDYRIMAQDTMEAIVQKLNQKKMKQRAKVDTRKIPLSGGDLPDGMSLEKYVENLAKKGEERGLVEADALSLANWYGTNSEAIFEQTLNPAMKELPLETALSLTYALEHEMTLTPIDFFLRRRDYMLFDMSKMNRLKAPVLRIMKEYLNWSDATTNFFTKQLDGEIKYAQLSALKGIKGKNGI